MKIIVVLAMFLFSSAFVSAQDVTDIKSETTQQQKSIEKPKSSFVRGMKVSTSSKSGRYEKSSAKTELTLFQELNSIDEDRYRIENNEFLSEEERTQQVNEINLLYFAKKEEFMSSVKSLGVMNVSQKEQKLYMSFLKKDNKKEEYLRVKELIKTSK